MASRHLNKHSVLMGYISFSFSIRYEGVSFVAIIYTDFRVNTTSFKLVLVIQITSNLHPDNYTETFYAVTEMIDVKGTSLYSSASEWGSVACHCEIFLKSVSLLLTRLLIWSAKMFFSNKHVSAYLSGIKDYSKFSW